MRSLAAIVRAARAARGLTATQFCKATGLSHSTLATIEYGGRPSLMTLAKLAAFLNVPASELDPQNTAYKHGRSSRRPTRPTRESRGSATFSLRSDANGRSSRPSSMRHWPSRTGSGPTRQSALVCRRRLRVTAVDNSRNIVAKTSRRW